MRGWWLMGLVGCAAPGDATDTEIADTEVVVDTEPEPLPDGLHGSAPAENLPAPEFVAVNRDGTARGQPDLIGHPTVVWFYPAAMTSG